MIETRCTKCNGCLTGEAVFDEMCTEVYGCWNKALKCINCGKRYFAPNPQEAAHV